MVRLLLLVVLTIPVGLVEAGGPTTQPSRIFFGEPLGAGYIWWRPWAVAYDEAAFAPLATAVKQLDRTNFDDLQWDDALTRSGISQRLWWQVYPVLACQGDVGLEILLRRIANLEKSGNIDKEWLVAVACLGRSASQKAIPELEHKLQAIDSRVTGEVTPRDVRIPLADALLCSLAQNGKLTMKECDRLAARYLKNVDATCENALEWVYYWRGEAEMRGLAEQMILACPADQIRAHERMEGIAGRLLGIQQFCHMSLGRFAAVTPLITHERIQTNEEAYLFVLDNYLDYLVGQSITKQGRYSLDPAIAKAIAEHTVDDSRRIGISCSILLKLRCANEPPPEWLAFLKSHQSRDNQDRPYIDDVVSRAAKGTAAKEVTESTYANFIQSDNPGFRIFCL